MAGKLKISYTFEIFFKIYFYNSVQFIVQALPWEVKMKIKKLIKQA